MTHALLSNVADLLRSISVARSAVRRYDELLSRGDEPDHAVKTVFEAYYGDPPDTDPQPVAPNRVRLKAWDRLTSAAPRYAE